MRLLTSAAVMILVTMDVAAICTDRQTENSPIVINFAHGPYRLTGAESPVLFDIRATGERVLIGWTAAGDDQAFLCLDRNYNGTIDDGGELFGNAVTLKDGTPAPNGFVALAELDGNQDRVVDAGDEVWSQLLLWRDLNHDGISQAVELSPVDGSGVAAIGLEYHWTGRQDSSGNTFRYQSDVWIADVSNRPTPRSVYDIFFVPVE
ncbi:MAG TPA: hypothetical protein VE974_17365 [Thermoanaerobaculia bacterium]|nr:hypothetical protein [Thermoanaerobaculia bacterium]